MGLWKRTKPNQRKVARARSTSWCHDVATLPYNRIIHHHNNASAYTSAKTSQYLIVQMIELIGHPPFSSDMVLSDFSFQSSTINPMVWAKKKPLMDSKTIFWKYFFYKNYYENWFYRVEKYRLSENTLKNSKATFNKNCFFLCEFRYINSIIYILKYKGFIDWSK